VHPEVLAAIEAANGGHQASYGRTCTRPECRRCSHGTSMRASSSKRRRAAVHAASLGAVICATTAHVHADEGGAPEKTGGIKLLPITTPDVRSFTADVGVDVLSFGGTKNDALGAEAIVVLTSEASNGLIRLRKLQMQLASKMRFVSAQLLRTARRRPPCAQRPLYERHGGAAAIGPGGQVASRRPPPRTRDVVSLGVSACGRVVRSTAGQTHGVTRTQQGLKTIPPHRFLCLLYDSYPSPWSKCTKGEDRSLRGL
jgi:hypothetical protein